MKVLVVDSGANADIAFVFDISTKLLQDPEIEVRFSKCCEDAITYALWFQPRVILFTGELTGNGGQKLIDKVHDVAPGALMLYMDGRQLNIHVTSLPDTAACRRRIANAIVAPRRNDPAMAPMAPVPG